MDAHLEHVPGLGTLTVRRLTGGDLEDLGRQTNGACRVSTVVNSVISRNKYP